MCGFRFRIGHHPRRSAGIDNFCSVFARINHGADGTADGASVITWKRQAMIFNIQAIPQTPVALLPQAPKFAHGCVAK
jgi:hypothetical protein